MRVSDYVKERVNAILVLLSMFNEKILSGK